MKGIFISTEASTSPEVDAKNQLYATAPSLRALNRSSIRSLRMAMVNLLTFWISTSLRGATQEGRSNLWNATRYSTPDGHSTPFRHSCAGRNLLYQISVTLNPSKWRFNFVALSLSTWRFNFVPLSLSKWTLPFLLFLGLTFTAQAQTIITYSYDNNGNRIRRHVEASRTSDAALAQQTTDETQEEEFVEEQLLYPNPTDGVLRFSLTLEEPATSQVAIFDLQGRQIYEARFEQQEFQVDLSEHKNGVYLVRWRFGTESRSTKIIKQ